MRPSSSPSEGLFSTVVARGPVAGQVTDAAWLRALLDVEAALARAVGAVGLVPPDAVRAVSEACADASAYDIAELGAAAAMAGNPVVPLVRAVEQRAGAGGKYVHYGATSQDILDTATILVARRSIAALCCDVDAALAAATGLAQRHRDTVMAGRTLLQQAVPTTFGLKAAGWAVALDGTRRRLAGVALPVQLGGAAGTLASYGGQGSAVARALATELDLEPAVLPWHTARLPIADLAGALGTAAGVVAKVAVDVVLLAQTEVGEVHEGAPGRGASSAMPHKRNPICAVQARAAARRAPGLVATLLGCMDHEHERAAGAWHAEWAPLSDLLVSVGTAVAWLRDCLEVLVVDGGRMRANLAAVGAEMAAEPLAAVLAPTLGRGRAHDVVASAVATSRAEGGSLRDVLLAQSAVTEVLTSDEVDDLLDVTRQVGEAPALVDAALAALGADTGRRP
jgi:3-carboxy-cis,cis-muconate cycloisomerase